MGRLKKENQVPEGGTVWECSVAECVSVLGATRESCLLWADAEVVRYHIS